MSNYKHGDWYCKPANEAEAKEIVERALASGAGLFDSVGDGVDKYQWDFLPHWGVNNGCTKNCASAPSAGTPKYTIEQVREKFPLLSEVQMSVGPHFEHEQKEVVRSDSSKPANWDGTGWSAQLDGKGLPLAGVEFAFSQNGVSWDEMVMLFNDGITCLVASKKYPANRWHYKSDDPCLLFRPIRSERELWVFEAQKHCTEFGGNQLGKLFDAIKSGDLKAPEVNK